MRIKICCMASVAEARLAIAHGASAVGLVGRMPSGPGPIEDDRIAEIAASVPPPVATFLLTSETRPEQVLAHVRRTGTGVVQLVDAVQPGTYSLLRRELPALRIVQVIHVTGPDSLEEARQAARLARDARVKKLYLFHFSRRYAGGNDHLEEARAVFGEVEPAPVYPGS